MDQPATIAERVLPLIAPQEAFDGIATKERTALFRLAAAKLKTPQHGKLASWLGSVESLPEVRARSVCLDQAAPSVTGCAADAVSATQIEACLRALMPWRKGPFKVFGVELDAEWRSDLKWARVAPHLDLESARVLDVGSGNGYFCYRALGAGARLVLGIDPQLLYVTQFAALNRMFELRRAAVLPLALEELSTALVGFDVVFSMGVLYHRRSPIDHLRMLRQQLKTGGVLVLETLIVAGDAGFSLMPRDRYAAMRNVWFVPTVETLKIWLTRVGFNKLRVVDESTTTREEQRRTPWMTNQSLADFLTPNDPTLTIEGYPAPRRAVILASKI